MQLGRAQNKLAKLFNALEDKLLGDANEALRDTAATVAQDAVARAPIDTGALRNSVFIEMPKHRDPKKAAQAPITIGFSVKYAMAVHERLDVIHLTGEAKYLWNAMVNHAPDWAAEMSKRSHRQARLKIGRAGMVDIDV